MRHGTAWFV